jgi:signal transduction histidine kinase
VEVSLSVNARSIMLSIKDDGIGLKEENRLKGRGITNMIMRARELGGQLTIFSDKGTNIMLEIPM